MASVAPAGPPSPFAAASAFAVAWTEAAAEVARASLAAYSDVANIYRRAGEAYASMFRQAFDMERATAQALTAGADELLRNELWLAEHGTADAVEIAEQGLARLAPEGLIPLPD